MHKPDDLADASTLMAQVWAECLRPAPEIPPGGELQHLVRAVDDLRLQLTVLQTAVDAMRDEARRRD